MNSGKKTEKKLFCLSKEEAQMLREKAKRMEVNESEYLRRLIRQRPSDHPEIKRLLRELINEVNYIGVNINQIVKKNNTKLYSPADKERLVGYMKKLNLAVKEVVDILGN